MPISNSSTRLLSVLASALLAMSLSPTSTLAQQSGTLLVANQKDRTLSLIDSASAKEVAAIPENHITGHEVAASPDGRTAYVPMYGDSGVGKPGTDGHEMLVIDLPTRKITHTVDFGHGVRPHLPVYDTHRNVLYVSTELDQTITAIDPHSYKILYAIPTGQPESHMFSLSHDGRFAYTANVGPGTVSVLDLNTHKTLAVLPIAKKIQRMSISNDDRFIFTSDVEQPRLAVIDTATRKIKTWIPLPAEGYGSTSTRDGRFLLLAVSSASKVAVIDLATMKVARTIDVPSAPQEILVRPDGRVAYVSCNFSHQVAAIDLTTYKVQSIIQAGNGADGLAWSSLNLSGAAK